MIRILALLWCAFTILFFSSCTDGKIDENYTNKVEMDRMLLILSAPSVQDPYYSDDFQSIVDFQIEYAKTIIGNDNVIIVVDAYTYNYYKGKLPNDALIRDNIYDIWMRDFTTVNPTHPVEFTYTWASMSEQESVEVQGSFTAFADKYEIQRDQTDFLIDGGNIVDNYSGKVVTTTRFMEDNNLTFDRAKQELMILLGATAVAMIEPDDLALAHADGMVCWLDEKTLLVNEYSEDMAFRQSVLAELHTSFPTSTIIEVPVEFTKRSNEQKTGIESACGINLNATVTYNNIYVPVFGMANDEEVVEIIKENTTKHVFTVNAEGVCELGGSVRCFTWQLAGKNAEKLIQAAREF